MANKREINCGECGAPIVITAEMVTETTVKADGSASDSESYLGEDGVVYTECAADSLHDTKWQLVGWVAFLNHDYEEAWAHDDEPDWIDDSPESGGEGFGPEGDDVDDGFGHDGSISTGPPPRS